MMVMQNCRNFSGVVAALAFGLYFTEVDGQERFHLRMVLDQYLLEMSCLGKQEAPGGAILIE